jgi:hypothetical protein
MDVFFDCPLDASLERSGFVESVEKQSQKMVHSFARVEHFSYFRNHIYSFFQQEEAEERES